MLTNYDKAVKPSVPGGLQVEVEFVFRQFVDISTTLEYIIVQGWLRLWWDDPRLAWDQDVWGVEQITFDASLVWVPDITVYENIEEEVSEYGLVIYPSGRVFFATPRSTKVGCPMDIKAFPYDRQKCNFTMGSWSHNGVQLDVAPRFIAREPDDTRPNRSVIDLSTYQGFQEWSLVATRSIWKNDYYTCCPEPYPVIIVELEIHRATRTYFSGMVAPIVLVTFISFMALLFPSPTSGARPALSVTMMLTIATVYYVASSSTPQSNDSTLIGRLYLAGMLCSFFLVFVSILSTALNLINSDQKISRKRLMELFRTYDKNHDGILTEDELLEVLRILNTSPEEQEQILNSLPRRKISEEQWLGIGDLAKKHDDKATFHNRIVQWLVQWTMRRRVRQQVKGQQQGTHPPASDFKTAGACNGDSAANLGPDRDEDVDHDVFASDVASVEGSAHASFRTNPRRKAGAGLGRSESFESSVSVGGARSAPIAITTAPTSVQHHSAGGVGLSARRSPGHVSAGLVMERTPSTESELERRRGGEELQEAGRSNGEEDRDGMARAEGRDEGEGGRLSAGPSPRHQRTSQAEIQHVHQLVAMRKGAFASNPSLFGRTFSSTSAIWNHAGKKSAGVQLLADKLASFSFVQSDVQRTGRQISAQLDSWCLCIMPPLFFLYLVLEVVGLWANRSIAPNEWGFLDVDAPANQVLQEIFDYRSGAPGTVICSSFYAQQNLYRSAFDQAREDCGWRKR